MRRLYYMALPLLLAATFAAGWVAPANSAAAEDATTIGLALIATDTTDTQALRQAAEAGDPSAQYQLAAAYYFGEGVPQDLFEMVRWTRKAAKQGHADAQYELGKVYLHGSGVAQDNREAVRWWREAAEQGHAMAQFNLGASYNIGQGVVQDYSEAVRWYRQGAEQGLAEAQFGLGGAYQFGWGVPEDLVYAHKWYNLAGSQGYTVAQENRRDVERRMTREQVAEAQRLAREWMREFEGRTEGQ